jgi:hypothetical protein
MIRINRKKNLFRGSIALSAVLFFAASVDCAEEVIDVANFENLIKAKNWTEATRIVDQNEAAFSKSKITVEVYLKNIYTVICCTLTGKVQYDFPEDEVHLVSHMLVLLFAKPCDGHTNWEQLKRKQADLVSTCFDCIPRDTSSKFYLERRQLAMRMWSLFMADLSRNLHLVPKGIRPFLNMLPPVNYSNEPIMDGMDPDALKDPRSRDAYKKALAENSALKKQLNLQVAAERLYNSCLSVGCIHIASIYRKEPDYAEIYCYLKLAMLDIDKIKEIMESVEKESGKKIPIGLLPEKTTALPDKDSQSAPAVPKVENKNH